MKLKQEIWLEGQSFVEETRELFLEGIRCYKAEAYKAALLFSYLGFQSMIKHRIIESDKPDGYDLIDWEKRKKNLINDDEKWEEQIKTYVKNKSKPILKISDDVYDQYLFWIARRNDCAHAKGNKIDYPHVEAFWLFVQSNAAKFVVNGGKEHIIKELNDHYDITITPLNQDVHPIISKIPFAVKKDDHVELLEFIESITKYRYYDLFEIHADRVSMWDCLLNQDEIKSSVKQYLMEENKTLFFKKILRKKPNLIKFFAGEDSFVRKTWMNLNFGALDYYIVFEMFRNNLIPEPEHEEIFQKILSSFTTDVFSFNAMISGDGIDESNRLLLKNIGFFKYFYKQAFLEKKDNA